MPACLVCSQLLTSYGTPFNWFVMQIKWVCPVWGEHWLRAGYDPVPWVRKKCKQKKGLTLATHRAQRSEVAN